MGTGRKLRRTWPQRLLLGFNALLVMACVAAAAGLHTFSSKLSAVETVSIDSPDAAPLDPAETRNILIVGTDSAANLDEDDPIQNGRQNENLADVIMIVRIDPEDGSARLLSIPRDSRVAVAPSGGMAKINSAMEGVDGPRNLIDTIRRNFGISIDNYVEVDFAAFKDLVDQLGGVPVYFAAPVRDRNTGLHISQPGCVVLDPDQALAYARARHFQYKDSNGRWRYDQTGDLGRITRQQDFIKRAMRRASEAGLRNPGTAFGIVDAAVDSVKIDDTLTTGMIMQLVSVFRTFNPDDLETQQVPTTGDMIGGVAYQLVDWDDTLPMLLPYWGYDEGSELAPGDVVVDVSSTARKSDSAALMATALDGVGFDAAVDSARWTPDVTTITFGDAGFEAAKLLATHLDGDLEFDYDDEIVGPRLELTLGSGSLGLRDQAIPVGDLPADLQTPPSDYQDAIESGSNGSRTAAGGPSDGTDPGAGDSGGTDTDGSAGGGGPGVDDSTTTLPVDEDPAFIQAAEAEGAPPGIVPTDPEKAALCS